MNFDGEKKDIIISGLEEKVFKNPDGTKYSLVMFKDQDGLKYKFYSNRKSDGEMTSAYKAYENQIIDNGKEIQVAYKEVPKEMVIDGTKRKWIDRFVSFFNLMEQDKQIPSGRSSDNIEDEIPF